MNKKIKYIPCFYEDEIKIFNKKNICKTTQENILKRNRVKENNRKQVDKIKINLNIIFDSGNKFPELVLENNSSLLQKVYKLGFYTFQSILDYYKINFEADNNSSFIVEFDNIILNFKKYEVENISEIQKQIIIQQQLIAGEKLSNSINKHDNTLKEWREYYIEERKERKLIERQRRIEIAAEKQSKIEQQKQIKELRRQLKEERRKEKNKLNSNQNQLTRKEKVDLIPQKVCTYCNKELFIGEKETIQTYTKRTFCNRICYSEFKINNKEKGKKRKLEYARKYSKKYNAKYKLERQKRKKEKIDLLPFQICKTCQKNIPKSIAKNKLKVYERIKFCSDNCKEQFPIVKQKQKAEQELIRLKKIELRKQKQKAEQELIRLKKIELRKEKIEEEKLHKIKLKEEKQRQKELYQQAVQQWDNLFKAN